MIKNDLYENLTGEQKEILDRAIEGTSFEECNPDDVMFNVYMEEIDDKRTLADSVCVDFEIYDDIRRFVNSQINDFDTRKQKLLEEGNNNYLEEQKYIDEAISEGKLRAEDILYHAIQMEDNIIKYYDSAKILE